MYEYTFRENKSSASILASIFYGGQLLKGRVCSSWSKSFPLGVDSIANLLSYKELPFRGSAPLEKESPSLEANTILLNLPYKNVPNPLRCGHIPAINRVAVDTFSLSFLKVYGPCSPVRRVLTGRSSGSGLESL